MRRRDFLRVAMGAGAGLAGGCRLSLEQGLLNACRNPSQTALMRESLSGVWEGVRSDQVWDMHAHLFGNGRSGSGIWVDPELDRPSGITGLARRAFFMNAGCVGDDDERMDQGMVARLVELADALPHGAKVMLLAFDFTHDDAGRRRQDLTTFAVPNEYARRIASRRPDRFEWIASVHPYREDALAALEAARAGGARAVKWLPPAMGIDLASPRCRPFYDALQRLDLPLLVHVGEEQAVAGARRSEFANPLHLRRALDGGVRVIAAHCATLGVSPDLDSARNPDKAPQVPNFEHFARLMEEKRYDQRLYGDISAVTQANRVPHLGQILQRREWHARLLNGSDYPLPGVMPLFSLNALVSLGLLEERAVPALRELREANALLFDFALKRSLRYQGLRLPASVFETRAFFERA